MSLDINAREMPGNIAYLWKGQGFIWVSATIGLQDLYSTKNFFQSLTPTSLWTQSDSSSLIVLLWFPSFGQVGATNRTHFVYLKLQQRDRETETYLFLCCIKKKKVGRCTVGIMCQQWQDLSTADESRRWIGSDIM